MSAAPLRSDRAMPGRSDPTMVVKRNPDATRQTILRAAFKEISRNGFRAASLDQILSETGLTKGALYHHFPNKNALGHAVLDEIIRREIELIWVEPLGESNDPVQTLTDIFRSMPAERLGAACDTGCPLNNLAQEMSAVDESFQQRIQAIYRLWRDRIAAALERGKTHGTVRADLDGSAAAAFLVAGIQGSSGLAKSTRDPEALGCCMTGLLDYLNSLRP